eukprot:366558-Chlamydomonas_euryale.AAC.3
MAAVPACSEAPYSKARRAMAAVPACSEAPCSEARRAMVRHAPRHTTRCRVSMCLPGAARRRATFCKH